MLTEPIGAYFAEVDTGVDGGVANGILAKSSSKNMALPNSHGAHSRRRETAERTQPMA
jgi:hypothetical protein